MLNELSRRPQLDMINYNFIYHINYNMKEGFSETLSFYRILLIPFCSPCISHLFFTVASQNPNKIALIHLLASPLSTPFLPSSLQSTPEFLEYTCHPPEYVASVLAMLRFGHAFLPLDPSWPKARVFSSMASSIIDLVIESKSSLGVKSRPS